jgi:hypothetical protein
MSLYVIVCVDEMSLIVNSHELCTYRLNFQINKSNNFNRGLENSYGFKM